MRPATRETAVLVALLACEYDACALRLPDSALQTLGFSAGLLGGKRVGRAEEAMSRAIWWYNRDVASGAIQAAGRR